MAKKTRSRKTLTERTCKQITELLDDYLSDRLNPAVKRIFEQHLSICSDCVNFLQTYRKTVATTGTLRTTVLPVKLRNNVLAFLRKKTRQIAAVLIFFAYQLMR